MQAGNRILKKLAIAPSAILFVGQSLAQEKPNIIFIITDQQTAGAMSNQGNPYLKTPAMDELARDGVTFTRAYCAYPLSGPSRASLFTGKMPNQVNVRENNDSLPREARLHSLGFMLTEAGYDCLYAGKWHIPTIDHPDNKEFGFEKVCGMNDPSMAEHIEKALSKKRTNPFFLVASYLNPHEACEYARSQTLHYGQIDIPENAILPPLPDNFDALNNLPELVEIHKKKSPKLYPTQNYTKKDWRRYIYAYNRLVERVDNEISKLLLILKEKGLYDSSIIIFTSDHGDGLAAHRWNQKRALFEENINIPLIIKPNKKTQKTGTINRDALINIGTDIFPTVCEFAQVRKNLKLKGIGMKGLVEGNAEKAHQSILIETNLDGIESARGWAVIKGNYKYVFYRFFKNREQLFNLEKDKGEMNNLIGNPDCQDVYKMMKNEMRKLAEQANDKMLIKDLNF